MIVGATYACPACALRFTRRDACPSCGGAVVSLADRDARTKMQGGAQGGSAKTRVLFTLSRWAPSKPWITLAVGVLMMTPAVLSLALDQNALLKLWFVDDRTGAEPRLYTKYEGLSERGFQILAVGAAGLLVASFSTLAWLGQRAAPARTPRKLRVHRVASRDDRAGEAAHEGEARDEVTGLARLATAELVSPLGGAPCLAFGLRGDVDGVEVDDADGGDFDLVLPDGGVVMVSLEHARLEPPGDEEPIALSPSEAEDLEDFLLPRVGQRVRESCTLVETVIAEGDTLTVVGDFRGKAIAVAPFRGAARGRVIGGETDRPLVVRVVARGPRSGA